MTTTNHVIAQYKGFTGFVQRHVVVKLNIPASAHAVSAVLIYRLLKTRARNLRKDTKSLTTPALYIYYSITLGVVMIIINQKRLKRV